MGISLEVYRIRIGTYQARSRSKKGSRGGTTQENWHPDWKIPWSVEENPPIRICLSKSVGKTIGLALILHNLLLFACVIKSPSTPGNMHDMSGLLMLGGDIHPNPGPQTGNFENANYFWNHDSRYGGQGYHEIYNFEDARNYGMSGPLHGVGGSTKATTSKMPGVTGWASLCIVWRVATKPTTSRVSGILE